MNVACFNLVAGLLAGGLLVACQPESGGLSSSPGVEPAPAPVDPDWFTQAGAPRYRPGDLPEGEEAAQYFRWLESFRNWPLDNLRLDFDGMDKSRFAPVPPPGVHPRVFIAPDEVPGLRERVKTERLAAVVYERLLEAVKGLEGNASYRQLRDRQEAGAKEKGLIRVMAHEALRCLIDEDEAAARELAAAAATWARARRAELWRKGGIPDHQNSAHWNPRIKEEFSGVGGWQHFSMDVAEHHHIGFVYDFIHGWMTEAERDDVRRFIADATAKHYSWGMGKAGRATHNWDVIHANLGILALAIEGEEGYDERVAAWTKQVLANYFTYGIYDSGVPHERGGKNAIAAAYGVPFSRRDLDGIIPVAMPRNLIAIPNLRRFVTGYIAHLRVPWQNTMQIWGAWGGSNTPMTRWLEEIMVIKYAYPDDPLVDQIWRSAVGDDYETFKRMGIGGHAFAGAEIITALLLGRDSGSGVEGESGRASLELPLDFFCPQRLLLQSRSDHSTNAVQFLLHAQQSSSAHPRYGRGHFLLNGLGRPWTFYASIADSGGALGHVGDAEHYSVVLVNGMGTGYENSRGVDYAGNSLGAMVAVDHRISFSWQQRSTVKDGAVWEEWKTFPLAETTPLYRPGRDIPAQALSRALVPDWDNPGDIGVDEWARSPLYERYPMRKAFRSGGLIRGAQPYVLLVDDYRKNDEVQGYAWQMIVQPDLRIEAQDERRIILRELEGDRRLLIQVLDMEGGSLKDACIEDYPGYGWSSRPFERYHGRRLVVPSWNVEPKFKMLLYPHRSGDPLPVVAGSGDSVRVAWPGQSDQIRFEPDGDGITSIHVRRGRGESLSLNGRNTR